MKDDLKKVIAALARKAESADKPHEAMQLAQAALNVAQALGILQKAEAEQ